MAIKLGLKYSILVIARHILHTSLPDIMAKSALKIDGKLKISQDIPFPHLNLDKPCSDICEKLQ